MQWWFISLGFFLSIWQQVKATVMLAIAGEPLLKSTKVPKLLSVKLILQIKLPLLARGRGYLHLSLPLESGHPNF